MMNRIFQRRLAALLMLCGLAACSLKPYRIDIQQGNVVTPEQVALLKPGMSKEQVRYLLGTPLLVDVFHKQRWDYFYRLEKGSTREVETRQVVIFFNDGGKVESTRIDVALLPDAAGNKAKDEKSRVYDIGVPAGKN